MVAKGSVVGFVDRTMVVGIVSLAVSWFLRSFDYECNQITKNELTIFRQNKSRVGKFCNRFFNINQCIYTMCQIRFLSCQNCAKGVKMFKEIIILIMHLVAYKFIIIISKLLGCLSSQRKRNNIFLSRTEDSPLKLYHLLQVCFIYDLKDSDLLKRQFLKSILPILHEKV